MARRSSTRYNCAGSHQHCGHEQLACVFSWLSQRIELSFPARGGLSERHSFASPARLAAGVPRMEQDRVSRNTSPTRLLPVFVRRASRSRRLRLALGKRCRQGLCLLLEFRGRGVVSDLRLVKAKCLDKRIRHWVAARRQYRNFSPIIDNLHYAQWQLLDEYPLQSAIGHYLPTRCHR